MEAVLRLGLVVALAALAATQSPYCNICSDHTLCVYPGKRSTCPFTKDSVPLTPAEKANFVHLHNLKRNKVAAGDEGKGNPGPQPSAANMLVLVWDDELATIAQRWADQCYYGHDACRNIKSGWVGQNVALTWGSGNMKAAGMETAVNVWYDEVKDFDRNLVRSYKFDNDIGHYSQVVWANTAKVGCGYAQYETDTPGYTANLFVCNYAPGGNYDGQAVYKEGPPRSACKSSCVNSAYPALCVA